MNRSNINLNIIDEYRRKNLEEVKVIVKNCIEQLYLNDTWLFNRNKGRGLCERCLVFRFAYYLQNAIPNLFVDCDFNSSWEEHRNANGQIFGEEHHGKPITNRDGSITNRFVDIIVHMRDPNTPNDFICFEIKKWNNINNITSIEELKDKNNLIVLTSEYNYKFGFYLILGKKKHTTRWSIYERGQELIQNQLLFEDETRNRS